ncbi:MAG: glycogen-binding domain-containing protein [Elusimicrobia bacterium]|nr:glycogen-binding domain-containing protein [Candidatus Liberimonas magnetica]
MMNRKNLISLIILDVVVMLFASALLFYRYSTLSCLPELMNEKTLKNFDNNAGNIKKSLAVRATEKIKEKPLAEKQVEKQSVPAKQAPAIEPSTIASNPETAPAKPASSVSTRNIRFTLRHSKAKKAEIIGEFNSWVPQPMKKSDANTWLIDIAIQPGEYAYNFVIDGRPMRDPNNPKTSNVGRGFINSLLRVKPLK